MSDHNEVLQALKEAESWMVEHGCSHEYAVMKHVRESIDRLAQAPHVPVSLEKLWEVFSAAVDKGKADVFTLHYLPPKTDIGAHLAAVGIKAVHALQLSTPQPDKIAGQSGKQIGWAWRHGDAVFFSDINNKPRDGFPVYEGATPDTSKIDAAVDALRKLTEFVQAHRSDLPEPWQRKDAGPLLFDAEQALAAIEGVTK